MYRIRSLCETQTLQQYKKIIQLLKMMVSPCMPFYSQVFFLFISFFYYFPLKFYSTFTTLFVFFHILYLFGVTHD